MNTLDEWELKTQDPLNQYDRDDLERIIRAQDLQLKALIDLVRKKDEALKLCYEKSLGDNADKPELNARAQVICIESHKALALTAGLK